MKIYYVCIIINGRNRRQVQVKGANEWYCYFDKEETKPVF